MPQKPSSPDSRQRQAIRETSAIVTRLLAHYWTANDRVETRQAQLEDWIVDLAEFGPAIVAEACASWRRGYHTRPTPADIRKLAIEEQQDRADRQRQTKHLAGPSDLDAWARSLGWASYIERQDAIAANEARYARGLAWQQEGA